MKSILRTITVFAFIMAFCDYGMSDLVSQAFKKEKFVLRDSDSVVFVSMYSITRDRNFVFSPEKMVRLRELINGIEEAVPLQGVTVSYKGIALYYLKIYTYSEGDYGLQLKEFAISEDGKVFGSGFDRNMELQLLIAEVISDGLVRPVIGEVSDK